jgi:hypothetical protein
VVRGGIGHVLKWFAEFYGKGNVRYGSRSFIRKKREEVYSSKKKTYDNDIKKQVKFDSE